MLATHLAYDTSNMQGATRWVSELQRRMVLLLPLFPPSRIACALYAGGGGMTPALDRLLADLRVWVRATDAPPPRSEADRLRERHRALEAENDPRAGWNAIIRDSLLLRLRELVDIRQDMRDLRSHIEAGGGPLATPLAVHTERREQLHATIVSPCSRPSRPRSRSCCSAPSGSRPAGRPAEARHRSRQPHAASSPRWTIRHPAQKIPDCRRSGHRVVGIGLFAILPQVGDFEMLTLALGAFFVPVGVLMAIPATQFVGTGLGFITATLLSLQSTYAADFVSYADGSLPPLLGVAGAVVITALVRSVGRGMECASPAARRLAGLGEDPAPQNAARSSGPGGAAAGPDRPACAAPGGGWCRQ